MQVKAGPHTHEFPDEKIEEVTGIGPLEKGKHVNKINVHGHVYCVEGDCGRYWCAEEERVY